VILTQTLGLAAAQVFATALDSFFQLTIMLVILMISLILLAHYRPFEEKAAQITQVLLRAAWLKSLHTHACSLQLCLYSVLFVLEAEAHVYIMSNSFNTAHAYCRCWVLLQCLLQQLAV